MLNVARTPEDELAGLGARHPDRRRLLLFGCRAGGDAREPSDGDLGHLAGEGPGPDSLRLDVVNALGADRVDRIDGAPPPSLDDS